MQFRSVIIDSATPTKQVAVKQGGIYIGETIIYSANAEGGVQFGVWEAVVRKTKLIDYPSRVCPNAQPARRYHQR